MIRKVLKISNWKKTYYYLKKNGLKEAYLAALERLNKSENDDYTVTYFDRTFKQVRYIDDNDHIIKDVSIFLYEGKVYFVDEKIEIGQKEITDNKLIITAKSATYAYDIIPLGSKEIYNFYNTGIF